jgi:sugar lactone lactonase YvrE
MGDVPVEVALSVLGEHAEGPLWDAQTAQLRWVDITGRRMHCFDPGSGRHTSWSTFAEPGGVILSASGDPVVATPVGLAALDRSTGELTLRVVIEQHRPENRTNDVKVDPRGRAWVGTMAFDKRPRNGALYRVDDEVASRVVHGLTISNGPAFDDAGTTLYLADTALGVIDVFDVEPETRALASRRRLVDLSDSQVWPDGMTVDDEGMLWVAIARASAVHRYRADGTLDGLVELPTTNPTSVAFGGADGDELYITTSWVDCEPDSHAVDPFDGAIFRCRPGVARPPSPRWKTAIGPDPDPSSAEKGNAP